MADLSKRVIKTQENVETIRKLIQTWKDTPMFMRIDNKPKEHLMDLKGIIRL
jgi:hypothetical protein